jgi:Ca-activated chloride channel family protein
MKKRGLPLVEILIILLILAVLAALLMPALTRAREEARSVGWMPREEQAEAVPGALPSLNEELWVIARAASATPAAAQEDVPGSGALMAVLPGREAQVPVPLKHTDVQVGISAYVATVDVTQQFHNPHDEKIEAVYVFPLPENAAVNEFVMTVGERRIVGLIRERREAERIYAEARAAGYVASLLTQERPNVFTQKVANIEPGRQIAISIRYFHTLAYADGWYEFVFPMVVGPRFNPPHVADGVGAVARGKAGLSGQATEVQYLKPGERSGHDVSLVVALNAGVPFEQVECKSHAVETAQTSTAAATVRLRELDSIPNKDFVLRYKVGADKVKPALLAHRDERGGFFSLVLYPPEGARKLDRAPLELVFVLDCSGSMNGEPIAQAKAAIRRALGAMQPGDTFQLIRFSEDSGQLGKAPLEANPDQVRRALSYLDTLQGEGGTMMIEGIKASLDFPHDPKRLRFVCFLTDGYIGNETEILAAVREKLGDSRIFSVGVGSSPNRYLLEAMAREGRGAVAYLGLGDSPSDMMDLFMDRISYPAMTDIAVDWGSMKVSEVYPARVPDLFVGRPVVVTGRYEGTGAVEVTVRGQAAGATVSQTLSADLDATPAHPGLPLVWARMKIADLARRALAGGSEGIPDQIKNVALAYGLISDYTAFVAVDSARRTEGGHGTTVAVPVPVPEGVRYDTTVAE